MYQQGRNTIHEAQDWQIDALERKYRHDSVSRHRHIVDEMDCHPTQWGVNMSKRNRYGT
jgi:hypothetical protein